MKITDRIKTKLIYPYAYLIISLKSFLAFLSQILKKDKVIFEQPYSGENIAILALYNKGKLRADIKNLLTVLKNNGAYVIAINTLKLKDDELDNHIDCYIERPNYGRDFGSYKAGFKHFYRNGWHKDCKRLLMLNDSLFYSNKNLDSLINVSLNSSREVLAATENYEIEHHLGSFFISFSKDILQKNIFRSFWKKYKNSDIRPKVIKKGEMGLTKVLKKSVSNEFQLKANFDISWFAKAVNSNEDFIIKNFHRLVRTSGRHVATVDVWPTPSMKSVLERVFHTYIAQNPAHDLKEINLDIKKISLFDLTNLESTIESLTKELATDNKELFNKLIRNELKNELRETFMVGSHIHQSGLLMHALGVPLIKLDGLYRGTFSMQDINSFTKQLEAPEIEGFQEILYKRPYGGEFLEGWKLAAFLRGLL